MTSNSPAGAARRGAVRPPVSAALSAVAASAVLLAVVAAPAFAQSAPEDLAPDAAGAAATAEEAAAEETALGWFHHWRATLDYSHRDGKLVDIDLRRNGDTQSDQVVLGIEAGIGRRGFARLEAGVDFGESERRLVFDDLEAGYDRRFIGGSGGIFLFPFFAIGAQARYGTGEEDDALTNRAFGEVTRTSRDDEEWRAAPFGLLTAPIGPVQLSLLGGYVHIERESDYSDPLLPDNDRASMDLWVANFGADWHITGDLRLGANVGWTEITDQELQSGAVALDEEWGSVDGHVGYQLFDGVEVTLRGGHDFDNSQGNGYRIGGGLAYRF